MMSPRRRRERKDAADATELVRRLGKLLDELRLTEAEVTVGEMRVRVQRATAPAVAMPATSHVAVATTEAAAATERASHLVTVEAPMVGTFYRASAPTAEPYVRENDLVKEGQIVCIIEAMKLMNEIETKSAGRIAKILVENGQAVEYGQPLFLIDPSR
jgi:acetyl-CoA carboxylase biotin carboxyl carrier protein